MTVEIRYEAPPAEVFCTVWREAGWGGVTPTLAEAALKCSLINAIMYVDNCVVGFVRVGGQMNRGAIPSDRMMLLGYGTRLIEALMHRILERSAVESTIGLMAAMGRESMYERFCFIARPTETYGAGMTLFVGIADR